MLIFLYFSVALLLFPMTLQAGCIVGDCTNGQGTRVYSSGCRYSGDWQNGLPHGHGIKDYPNGNRYEGQWRKGKRHGNGMTTLTDGRVFKETWRKEVVLTQVTVFPDNNMLPEQTGLKPLVQPVADNSDFGPAPGSVDISLIVPRAGPAVDVNEPDEFIPRPETEAEQMDNMPVVQTPLSPHRLSKQKDRSAESDVQDSSTMGAPESIQLAAIHPSPEPISEPSVTREKARIAIGKQGKSQAELHEDEPAARHRKKGAQLETPDRRLQDAVHEMPPLTPEDQPAIEDTPAKSARAVRDEVQHASLEPSSPEFVPGPEVIPRTMAQVVGEGTVVDPAGSVYVGQLLNHRPHGHGILTFVDGSVYEGEFHRDSREGHGVLTLANGEKYVGRFHNNEAHGQGEYFFPDGRKYVGAFEHDFFGGEGVLSFPDGVRYSGRFHANQPHGFGVLVHPDGRKYVGNFANGLFHGWGRYIFADGEERAGNWLAGEYTGE